ncbi:DUF58 domain-containing protein [Ornithinibacillus halotolerans]|uniref:DUF58 domain-containing protein n=1 Tax=Ornithinibacillus halotolerans TaxID=1274357 RepID=A0A916W321_9BACI|nr:DUF58 domain-containing protein [Ornithinibacillus halotolerans]GGA61966.1 hypothetical protein GCM10008025_02400 [Ornithinibacillus halotolerans]
MSEPLLSSKIMYQLANYRIQSRNSKRGHHKGSRRSTRQGSSIEFSDYRMYQPGDDLRQIDWNIYARTKKHYIKRFLDEQEIVVSIYLDCTNSMAILSEKWRFAKQLAASFGYMALHADDRVGIFPIGAATHPFTYKKGKAFMGRMVQYVDSITSEPIEGTFSEKVHTYIQPKSSLSILISDLLEPIELIESAIKKLQAQKQELYIIQLLSQDEIDPFYQGDLELVDSETNEKVNVTMSRSVKSNYYERLNNHTEKLERFCFERGIGFIQCSVTKPIEDVLFNQIASKGWI